jgi:hypothetical protein
MSPRICILGLFASFGLLVQVALAGPVLNVIMPEPQKYSFEAGNIEITQASVSVSSASKSALLQAAITRFQANSFKFGPGVSNKAYSIHISIVVQSDGENLDFGVGSFSCSFFHLNIEKRTMC